MVCSTWWYGQHDGPAPYGSFVREKKVLSLGELDCESQQNAVQNFSMNHRLWPTSQQIIFHLDVGNRIFILHNYFGHSGDTTRNESASCFCCHVPVLYSRSFENTRYQEDISIKIPKHSNSWWMQGQMLRKCWHKPGINGPKLIPLYLGWRPKRRPDAESRTNCSIQKANGWTDGKTKEAETVEFWNVSSKSKYGRIRPKATIGESDFNSNRRRWVGLRIIIRLNSVAYLETA